MEKLDLAYNRIGDGGVEYLTACLHNLKILRLFDSSLSQEVSKSLAENLVGCQVVSSIFR